MSFFSKNIKELLNEFVEACQNGNYDQFKKSFDQLAAFFNEHHKEPLPQSYHMFIKILEKTNIPNFFTVVAGDNLWETMKADPQEMFSNLKPNPAIFLVHFKNQDFSKCLPDSQDLEAPDEKHTPSAG